MIYEIKTVNGVKTKVPLTGNGYGLPLGTIIAYEGSVPDGFLACDGSAYNTTTYSALYALLGVGTTPNLTSQNMTNTDGWCIKATPAYVEPDTVSDMVNTLRTQDSYSTSEVNTGKKWIDGKPIYRKCYYSATGWANNTVIDTITDIDMVVELRAIGRDSGDNCYFQNHDNSGNFVLVTYKPSTSEIIVKRQGSFANNYPSWNIIEYTKTTD